MIGKLSRWLYKVSPSWVALVALVGFLLFAALVLPGQAAEAEAKTGTSVSPDTSFFYTPTELYAMAEAYGPEGRQAYIRARFTFDLIFPVVYLVFLATTISWVYTRAFDEGSPWRRANPVPVVGAAFDYLENVSTSLVMARYPALTPVIVTLAPVFTLIKWIFVGGSFIVLLLGVVIALIRWVQARRSPPTT
ncbi:MAG: hypothetical protein ACP5HS_11565 [Anaerolineae bacterium]